MRLLTSRASWRKLQYDLAISLPFAEKALYCWLLFNYGLHDSLVENQYIFSVSVKTAYLPEQSNEEESRFAFAYTVTITNTGTIAAQLISRHWVITDADGKMNEVRGLGVVGAQPLLQPKEAYEYTSGTVINTRAGSMHGSYQIVAVDGTPFEAEIAPFTLAAPRILH